MADFTPLMNKPLKASKKSEGKQGQTYWNQCGLTVWLGDYNGQPQVSLVDERTGQRYPCFPPKPRQQSAAPPQQTTAPAPQMPGQAAAPNASGGYPQADYVPPDEEDPVPF